MSTTRTLALALAALLAPMACSGSDNGSTKDGSASGDTGGGSGFVGSCTEAGTIKVCVDYYTGYTTDSAKELCASTGDIWDDKDCATVNAGLTPLSGHCKVVDHLVNDRVSDIFYYSPEWNEISAKAHCGAYPTGYTATWIPG